MNRMIAFVRFCYASATVLRDKLGIPTDNLICLFKECIELAKHCNDQGSMIVSSLELVLQSNSIGKHGDSVSCLKDILPLVLIPEHALLVYEYLAMTNEQLKEFDNVETHSKKWIDIAQNLGNKESEMYGCLSMGRALLSLSRYNEAIDFAERSLEIAKEGNACAKGEALAYTCIMRAYSFMQRYDDVVLYALKLLHCTLKTNDQKSMINAYVQLGKAHHALRQYQDAAECGKKLIEIARQKEDGSRFEAWGYLFMGKTYLAISKYDTAISYCNQCIELARVIGERHTEADAYNLLGRIYHDVEKYDDAISCCNKCVTLIEKDGNEWKAADATAYLVMGQANKCLKKYDEAIQNFKQCIDVLDAIGQRREEMLTSYLALGEEFQTLERYTDAVYYIEKCISIAQEINAKETQITAYSLLSQVYMNSMQLQDLSKSIQAGMAVAVELGDQNNEEFFKESLCRLHKIIGLVDKTKSRDYLSFKQPLVPDCSENDLIKDLAQAMNTNDKLKKHMALINLNKFYGFKKDYKKAIHCLEQLKEVDVSNAINLFCFSEIGRMYQAMGQYDAALRCYEEGLTTAASCSNKRNRFIFYSGIGKLLVLLNRELNLAKRYLKEAIRCFEAIFTTLGSRDEFKISIFDQYIHSYKLLALLLISDEQIVEALLILDRCRARALKDSMISNLELQQEDSSEAEYLEFKEALRLVSKNDFSIAYYSLILNAMHKFLFKENANVNFSIHPNQITIDDINKKYIDKLFEEIGVCEQVKCEDRCLDEEDILKERKGSKDESEDLNKPTPLLLNLNLTRGDSNEKSTETDGSTLESLFRILGCDKILSSKQDEVVFIPEGPLYKVPFPALRDPSTGKYLSETKRIRLAPSLVTLKHFEDFQTKQTSNAKPLIIGSPLVGTVMMGGKQRDIEPLFGALDEALDIAAILGVRALVAAKATKPAVLEKLREGVSVVHIAAHGVLSQASIVLAPSPEIKEIKAIPDEEDYMLTMADVQQAQVRAQLVVLSCCHSGRGEIRAEGVVGMCRAFLASGARAVVASLWAIDDEATLAFMRIFYGHLKHGKSASTSLQLTMNDMRGTTDYKDVKKWAPFFLIGDDVTLNL